MYITNIRYEREPSSSPELSAGIPAEYVVKPESVSPKGVPAELFPEQDLKSYAKIVKSKRFYKLKYFQTKIHEERHEGSFPQNVLLRQIY